MMSALTCIALLMGACHGAQKGQSSVSGAAGDDSSHTRVVDSNDDASGGMQPDASHAAPQQSSSSPPAARTAQPPRRIEFAPGIVVMPDDHVVELDALVCLDAGYLEQIACSPQTREHESLVVVRSAPSQIHAAMLLAGFEPGRPGYWTHENQSLDFHPPQGDFVDVLARYTNDQGSLVTEPIRRWIIADDGRTPLPLEPWVFGGSAFESNPRLMDAGEHYVADMTGSIIGLVTFGDEVIGFSRVMADQQDVQPLEWMVDVNGIPPIGTPVTVIIRRWSAPSSP